MKLRTVVIIIALIILADQALKIYIKTTFHLNTTHKVAGEWFQLFFVENPGMAYGWKFGGEFGKMALTIFRLIAVLFGTWYIGKAIKEGRNKWFMVCVALIYAGALGNLIDSCFYGMIFDKGMVYNPQFGDYVGYQGLAKFASPGYSSFLHGNVVDMFYFPIIRGTFPSWVPVWGGEPFEFFRPIFNIADAAISTGVIAMLIFQKKIMDHNQQPNTTTVETTAVIDDNSQVS